MDFKALLKPAPDKADLAMTIIRVIVGLVFLVHGWQKVFTFGFEGVGGFFGSLGIPAAGFFAVVVSLVELLGGLALILGLATRLVGLMLAVDMLVALFVVHLPNGFFVSENGYELVLLLGAAALAFAITGASKLSLDSRIG
ncbi:DoxX family protein [Candidatus Leptofilum sp.]|uniref:DoxX family protein n=1 Tax=Candidatus Leptofilum sp. TaxID=3241576 RepID=UPI003B5CE489